MTVPFWKALDDSRRERLFAFMRELDSEQARFFERGRETPGTIPVGAALFDEVLQGAIRLEFVMVLRTAPTLEIAAQQAAEAVRLWVRKHNARRPNDVNWQRWVGAGQADLEGLIRRLRGIVS